MQAYTDPKKIRITDPGNPDGCVIYAYHEKFSPDNLIQVGKDFRSGKLGCVAQKKEITKVVENHLCPIREKRVYYEKHHDEVRDIIQSGDCQAREVAQQTMNEVRELMKMG